MHHRQVYLQLHKLQCLTLTSKAMRPGCNLPSVYPVPAYHSKVHQRYLTLSNNATTLQPGAGSSSQTSVPGQHLVDQTISTPCRNQDGVDIWIKPLTTRITKCAGCGGPYIDELCAYICVATEDIYTLTFSSGQTISKTKTYFHPFQPCIKEKFPHFLTGSSHRKLVSTRQYFQEWYMPITNGNKLSKRQQVH